MPDTDAQHAIDWMAVVDRLETVIAARGLERDLDPRAALTFARRSAIFGGEPPGESMSPGGRDLLAFCRAHALSLDAILLGHRR
jgi:hypothetical protein